MAFDIQLSEQEIREYEEERLLVRADEYNEWVAMMELDYGDIEDGG